MGLEVEQATVELVGQRRNGPIANLTRYWTIIGFAQWNFIVGVWLKLVPVAAVGAETV